LNKPEGACPCSECRKGAAGFLLLAKKQELDGFDGALVPFNNLYFVYDLSKKKTLTITAEGLKAIVGNLNMQNMRIFRVPPQRELGNLEC
jgi:hypothetical protein